MSTATFDLPSVSRLLDERAALSLLPQQSATALAAEYIPFSESWLDMRNAAQSAEMVARLLAARVEGDIAKANSLANWLRRLAHELDAQVLAEQVRRTRELADEQDRQIRLRRAAKRLNEEVEQDEARAAIERLIDEVL